MEWKTLWHYHLVDFGRPLGELKDITQKLRLLPTAAGSSVRLKLDNRYNSGEMRIRSIEAGTQRATVRGKTEVVLGAGETAYTDPVEVDIRPGQWLEVYMDIGEMSGICAMCQTWSAETWQTEFYPEGDRSKPVESVDLFEHLRMDVHKPTAALGISHIDVLTGGDVRTVALFGDSITHMSYYYDPLLRQVLDRCGGKVTLANEGIGGNRLCHDPAMIPGMNVRAAFFGPAGYKRFEGNVYDHMKPDAVLFLEGINDFSHGYQMNDAVPTTDEFIARCTEVVGCAHRHGSRIYLGTVMPASAFDREEWYPKYEELRQDANRWIRTQHAADGVIDFDEVMRDPENISGIIPELMMEDGLHPNTAGGRRMAAAVPMEFLLS